MHTQEDSGLKFTPMVNSQLRMLPITPVRSIISLFSI
uniref:Uncharacterized protein n=1 Tax=Arundo donax TaxID=35708 RepID=A0A0A8YZX8_ARUDO